MPRILVVEDDPRVARFVSAALAAAGHVAETAPDGLAALGKALANRYDLIILDLLLPRIDGFSVLERLARERPDQPVLVLSALSDAAHKVRCLDLGAEDYLAKPFELPELLARVRARLRSGSARGRGGDRVRVGALSLDVATRSADPGTGPVRLSEREFLLLRHLVENAGGACTRQELLAEAWGYSFDPGSNLVDVYVARLRRKLGPHLIETIRGVGYRLSPPAPAPPADRPEAPPAPRSARPSSGV